MPEYKFNLIGEENLIKLRKLTQALEFAEIVRPKVDAEIKELVMDEGTSYMVGLFKSDRMAVARNYASKGCRFPNHSHQEFELLVLYTGEMHIYTEGKKRVIKERQFYYLNPGQEHSAYFPKETWFLAITMPASDDWPEGG